MADAVTFDYSAWVLRYPEFASVPQALAQLYFNEATVYCENSLRMVQKLSVLTTFLNQITAHIAQLNSPTTATGANSGSPPGAITQAAEGSVNVTFEMNSRPGSESWWNQTKYGAAYWQASLPYRLTRYVPTCPPGFASLGQMPWPSVIR